MKIFGPGIALKPDISRLTDESFIKSVSLQPRTAEFRLIVLSRESVCIGENRLSRLMSS